MLRWKDFTVFLLGVIWYKMDKAMLHSYEINIIRWYNEAIIHS